MASTIPKILHAYWGKDKPLSWLRWLTVKTFAMLNPSWQVIVWYPDKPGLPPRWITKEHSHYTWTGPDWFKKLNDAGPNVQVRKADLSDFPPLSEVHRSDLFRWRLLHTMGGFWSDIDIIYFRPMDVLDLDYTTDSMLCWGEIEELAHWQAIGFLAGKPGSLLFKAMEELGLALAQAPNLGYQVLGTDLLLKFAEPGATEAVGARIGQIPQHAVYPFSAVRNQQAALWQQQTLMDVKDDTVGVHWFAAQKRSCAKEAAWTCANDVQADPGRGGVRWAMGQAGMVDLSKDALKYSIIMPYIDRTIQLHNTLASYHHWYSGRTDWELILVADSKCRQRPELDSLVDIWRARGLDIIVVDFQADDMYNPACLFNVGAKAASGEFLVLTSPEIYHNADVLGGFDAEFERDRHRYVTCACLALDKRQLRKIKRFGLLAPTGKEKWIQHGVHRPAQYHFCSAIAKELYEAIGGFDEAFAKGFCFDDDDFRDTVIKSGAVVVQRDDLVTFHQYHDSCVVPDKMDKWRINKALYEAKHGEYEHLEAAGASDDRPPPAVAPGPPPLVFAWVLKGGGPFTPDYVARLRNRLRRNAGVAHNFLCLTDMKIDCPSMALTDDLPGWWSKIELFRPGLFTVGKVVYFDLDTLVLADLSRLMTLPPGFHALRPWNRHNRIHGYCGSGFMAWDAGRFNFIYERFMRRHMEEARGGDQEYISKMLSKVGVGFKPLQESMDGIYSYKRQCRGGPPQDARVVCFHGRPRVHECQDQWVREAWR